MFNNNNNNNKNFNNKNNYTGDCLIDFIDESPDICEKILEKAHKIIYKE